MEEKSVGNLPLVFSPHLGEREQEDSKRKAGGELKQILLFGGNKADNKTLNGFQMSGKVWEGDQFKMSGSNLLGA